MRTLLLLACAGIGLALMSAGTAFAAPIAGDGYANHSAIAHYQATHSEFVHQVIGAIAEPELVAEIGFIPAAAPVRPHRFSLGVDRGIVSPLPELIPK